MLNKITPPPLRDLCARSLYQQPSTIGTDSHEQELRTWMSSLEPWAVTEKSLLDFRFHADCEAMVNAGYPMTACLSSLKKTLEAAQRRPMEQASTLLAPEHPKLLGGMNKYGEAYAFHIDGSWYRIDGHRLGQDTLPSDIGLALAESEVAAPYFTKRFLQPPAKFELIYSLRNGDIWVRDAQGRTTALGSLPTLGDPPDAVPYALINAADVSLSGRYVALILENEEIRRYDRDNLGEPQIHPLGDAFPHSISVTDNGELYVGARRAFYEISATGTVTVTEHQRPETSTPRLFALSPDERYLALQDQPDGFVLLDRENHREIFVESTQANRQESLSSLALSPLNLMLAVAYRNGGIALYDLLDADARGARFITDTQIPAQGDTPLPLISFGNGFDQLHVVSRDADSTIRMTTLTLPNGRAY